MDDHDMLHATSAASGMVTSSACHKGVFTEEGFDCIRVRGIVYMWIQPQSP